MAKNLYEVVLNLLCPFLVLGIVSAVNFHLENKRIQKWHWKGVLLMFFITAVMSVLRQWRLIKYNQIYNIYILVSALIAGLIYIISLVIYFHKYKKNFTEVIITLSGLLLVTGLMLYKIPLVIFLPLQFLGLGENIFTTMYLLKITGFLCGWLCVVLIFRETYRLFSRCTIKSAFRYFFAAYLLSGFTYFVAVVGIINSYYRKRIGLPLGLRKAIPTLITLENAVFFFIIFLIVFVAVVFFMKHLRVHGEYNNPAEHRLLRRYERDSRRIGAFVFLLGAFCFFDMTFVKQKANQLVELSPSEEFQIEGNRIFIPLEQVSDGYLHRFSWTNGKNVTVRFIIVQKKGTSFGVGFDACEVCGNVGYYERKNEVVCNRCDVVMNKNTIGLKGGCNPIPLEYSIEDGGIVVYTEDLDRESYRF